jgi:hypothetical protein
MANAPENVEVEGNNQPPANIFNRAPLLVPPNIDNPRTLGFFSTYRSIFCPTLRIVSFIFIISAIDIFIYIACIVHSLSTGGLGSERETFLAPSNSTLFLFGSKVLLLPLIVSLLYDIEKKRMVQMDHAYAT